MNLSQETIDSEIQFAKTASKSCRTTKIIGCFTETIGCLYQQTTNKTEFKELEIERLYTVVYTCSLQNQSYIQSSQKPWGNPLTQHIEHLKKHTLLGQHTYTKIADLDPLKNTQPILANTETKLVFTKSTRITLVTEDNLKSIQAESYSTTLINHTLLAISALWKTQKLLVKTCQRLIVKSVFLNLFKDVVCYQIFTNC